MKAGGDIASGHVFTCWKVSIVSLSKNVLLDWGNVWIVWYFFCVLCFCCLREYEKQQHKPNKAGKDGKVCVHLEDAALISAVK
jgi:hypothetical protein